MVMSGTEDLEEPHGHLNERIIDNISGDSLYFRLRRLGQATMPPVRDELPQATLAYIEQELRLGEQLGILVAHGLPPATDFGELLQGIGE